MLALLSNSMLSPLAIVKSSFKAALPYTDVFVTSSPVSMSIHCFVMTELLLSTFFITESSGYASYALPISARIWLSDMVIPFFDEIAPAISSVLLALT